MLLSAFVLRVDSVCMHVFRCLCVGMWVSMCVSVRVGVLLCVGVFVMVSATDRCLWGRVHV